MNDPGKKKNFDSPKDNSDSIPGLLCPHSINPLNMSYSFVGITCECVKEHCFAKIPTRGATGFITTYGLAHIFSPFITRKL